MGEVKRSGSKGDISNLLDDIRGIVNDNKQALDVLKTIKQKNEEISNTKRIVDISSIVSEHKKEEPNVPDEQYLYFPLRRWSEINIPHRKSIAGEHQSEIDKRNKRFAPVEELDDDDIPVIEADAVVDVESVPPAPTTRDDSEEGRMSRREKSVERRRKMEARRQKTYDRRADPEPTAKEPEREWPRRGRESRRSEPVKPAEKKPEEKKPDPPSRRRPVPSPVRSGKPTSPPPVRNRNRSGPNRRDQSGVPTVEVGSRPTEHAAAPGSPTGSPLPFKPRSYDSVRGRTLSGHSDTGHGHLFRIRKDSEGSVEIVPDFIEEHNIVSEFESASDDTDEACEGASPSCSLPRSKWYTKANITSTQTSDILHSLNLHSLNLHSLKRRIILEKCPHCQDGDSPPEIEIRICKRSGKCGRFRTEDDIHMVPGEIDMVSGESLPRQATPRPPARDSSLNRIPQDKSPLSPYYRTKSPSEMEMERLSRRLTELKQEVNTVIKEYETNNVPLDISVTESTDRPRSPYHPDKTSYYRARYHSGPHSPTGQDTKTTSTTELLNPRVYHPAKEERSSQPAPLKEVLHLSTQSLELPEDDGGSITEQLEVEMEYDGGSMTEQLEMEVESLSELQSHFVPVQNQAPAFYDHDDYEPECDVELPGPSTNHVNLEMMMQGAKREEQLLTPPPLPSHAAAAGDIALRKDILYDPFHIGTTYVVLSKQNHGRFLFHAPTDPNSSVPGSHKSVTPVKGSPKSKPTTPVKGSPRLKKESAIPVSSTPPVLSPSISITRRALYQPKSVNGRLMSVTSLSSDEVDATPSKLESPKPSKPAASHSGSVPPPLPARSSGKHMAPDQRRGFIRPSKEPAFRELAVDAPDKIPPVLPGRSTPDQQRNLASRDFHLQTIMDVESPGRLDTWSGAPPPAERGSSHPRPFSPNSENSLRRSMPHVKLLGDEWKELAQGLGYENSHIASFARDYPDPGQALLDHWSKQPASRLDHLLKQLKFMGLWKTAHTLDKTFDTTNV